MITICFDRAVCSNQREPGAVEAKTAGGNTVCRHTGYEKDAHQTKRRGEQFAPLFQAALRVAHVKQ